MMKPISIRSTNIAPKLICIGVGLAGLFWILESCIHVFVFHDGNFIQQILTPQPHEIWMRLIVVVLLVLFGIYAQLIIIQRKGAEEALKEKEATLKSILDAAPIGIGVVENRVFKFTNDYMLKMTGYSREELVGQSARIVYETDEEFDRIGKVKYAQIKEEGVGAVETRFKCKDGRVIDVWLSSSAIVTSDLSKGIAFTALNITERKQAEDVLQESEERYRNLYENAPNAYFSVSLADGSILRCNLAAMRLLGYEEKTLQEMKVFDLYADTPDGKSKAQEVFKNVKTGGSVRDVELQMQHKDGHPVWISLSVDPVKDESGNIMETRSMATDISRRKQAEDALRQERDMAQQYLDIAGVIFVALDSDGNVTLINSKGCEVLGDKAEEVIGKNWFDQFIPERMREDTKVVFQRLMHGEIEPAEYFENPVVTKNGKEKFIAWHNTTLKDKKGKIIGTLSSGEDITARKQAEDALRESEEKYRLLIENIPSVTWMTSEDGHTVFISPNVEKIYGYSQEEIYGGGDALWFGRIHSDDKELVRKVFDSMFTKEQEFDVEYRIRRKDGKWIWVHDRAILAYEKDDVRYAYGVFSDITDRKQAEEALRESEERYRVLIDTAREGVWAIDTDAGTTFVNRQMANMLGYAEHELLGRKVLEFLDAESEAVFKEKMETRRKGLGDRYDLRFLRKDGSELWAIVNATPIFSTDGHVVGSFAMVTDVTDRKQMENELKKSEKRYRILFESAVDAIFILKEEVVVECNSKALEIFGGTRNQIIGHTPYDFSPSIQADGIDSKKKGLEKIRKVLDGEPQFFEWRHTKFDGTPFDAEVGLSLVELSTGTHIQAIVRDITARKQTEETLRKSQAQLRALASRLQEIEEIERKQLARELHDSVGQTLTALNLNLNIMRNQLPAEALENVAARLDDSASLVEEATHRIRDVMAELRPQVLDDYGLAAALRWYGERFEERTGVPTVIRSDEGLSRMPEVTESALFRIAQEALTNVAKHAEASEVSLKLDIKDHRLRLTIADNGKGFVVAPLEISREKFGWGLLTMEERAQALGGQLYIESQPGNGTRITVELKS